MVHSISKEELLEAGCLHAGKLDEAFALYRSAIISANNESDMLVFIRRLYSVNEGAVFADFYYPVLDAQSQERFRACLNGPQLKWQKRSKHPTDRYIIRWKRKGCWTFLLWPRPETGCFQHFILLIKKRCCGETMI